MANPIHRAYRKQLGFTNQDKAREFLTSKIVDPGIDADYINRLTDNLCDISQRLNSVFHPTCRHDDIEQFCELNIRTIKQLCNENRLFPRFNNHRRRIEAMFYSWLCGHAMAQLLIPSLGTIFGVPVEEIEQYGDDTPANPESFARTAKADLILPIGQGVLVEVQAGFQGKYNDLKKHKHDQAIKELNETQLPTICVMFDVFNGRVGFLRLDELNGKQLWIPRGQFEGQLVYEVPEDVYQWQISDTPPILDTLNLNL